MVADRFRLLHLPHSLVQVMRQEIQRLLSFLLGNNRVLVGVLLGKVDFFLVIVEEVIPHSEDKGNRCGNGKPREDPLCPADISPSMGRPCGEKATSDVMKKFSKLLYEVKKEYHKHQEELSQDMSDEEFMALYEQLEELNELGDDFLDEHQEEVTPAVAKMMVENLDKYV